MAPARGLGKRKKRDKDGAKHKAKSGSVQTVEAPAPAPVSDVVGAADGETRASAGELEERGAFAFARCDKCGWQGPGRRSRERARKDLVHHLEDKPKHADHVAVSGG